MKPDPEHLVALALSGVLPLEQTEEILASVTFTGGYTFQEAALRDTLNKVSDQLRAKRETADAP